MKIDLLTQEQIEHTIERTRSAIAQDITDNAINDFLHGDNQTAAKTLLRAIEAFHPQEKGLQLWKEYFGGYDDIPINAFLQNEPRLTTKISYMLDAITSLAILHDNAPVSAHFQVAGRLLLMPEIDTLDFTRYFLINAFMDARKLASGDKKNGEPLLKVLHPYLRTALESASSSVESLRQAAGQPLVAEDVVWKARERIVRESLLCFNEVATDFLDSSSENKREKISGLIYQSLPHGQRFGVELEGILPSTAPTLRQAYYLEALLRKAGLKATVSPLGIILPKLEQSYRAWNITRDSTVINPLRYVSFGNSHSRQVVNNSGLEIISPVLAGAEGGNQASTVIDILRSSGFRTNGSSGFHVHVDVSTASLRELKNLSRAYLRNERRFDDFIHPDKRGEGTFYARTLSRVNERDILAAESVADLVAVMNVGSRNYKFDMTNLTTPGAPPTVQYRAEGGTQYLDAALNYMILVVNFTHSARANPEITVDNLIKFYQNHRAQRNDEPPYYPDDPYPVDRHAYSKFRSRFPEGGT